MVHKHWWLKWMHSNWDRKCLDPYWIYAFMLCYLCQCWSPISGIFIANVGCGSYCLFSPRLKSLTGCLCRPTLCVKKPSHFVIGSDFCQTLTDFQNSVIAGDFFVICTGKKWRLWMARCWKMLFDNSEWLQFIEQWKRSHDYISICNRIKLFSYMLVSCVYKTGQHWYPLQ